MRRPVAKALLLVAGAALALDGQARVQPGFEAVAEFATLQEADLRRGTRLELVNFLDLQYFVSLGIGTPAQKVTSIVDTGSFELVVFASGCQGCGKAGVFNSVLSGTHTTGNLVTELTYGSGDVEGDQVQDVVTLGPGPAKLQGFWEVHKASMPLLFHAKFQSIMGVGPPETPSSDAWGNVAKAVREASDAVRSGRFGAPNSALVQDVENYLTSAVGVSRAQTMLSNFHVRAFSICLGRKPGASGYLVWNDTVALEHPQLFSHLPVVGRHSWTVRMSGVHLRRRGPDLAQVEEETHIACRDGCGAIVDSGTSLMVAPASAIALMSDMLQMNSFDCESLPELPSLVLTFGSLELSLPPDSYVSRKRGSSPCKLELSVLQSTSMSEVGPVWILGMPFLRQYYTTFDVGAGLSTRAIRVAPATGNCTPHAPGFELAADRGKPYLRSIDRENMYLPPLVKRVTSQGFLRI